MIFLQKWLLLAAFPWFLSASSEPLEPEADEPSPIADAPEGMRPEELRRLHRKLDRNGDGKVSFSEIMDFAHHTSLAIASRDGAGLLEEFDSDNDGSLSLEEHLKAYDSDGEDTEEQQHLSGQWRALEMEKFKAADVDQDQLLNPTEMVSLFNFETSPAVLDVVVQHTLKSKDRNHDGVLSAKEFWEIGAGEQLREQEVADFRKLDKDGNGVLNVSELRSWESGIFHIEDAMMDLLRMADKDGDEQATVEEFEDVRFQLAGTDAQYHFIEWIGHHEL